MLRILVILIINCLFISTSVYAADTRVEVQDIRFYREGKKDTGFVKQIIDYTGTDEFSEIATVVANIFILPAIEPIFVPEEVIKIEIEKYRQQIKFINSVINKVTNSGGHDENGYYQAPTGSFLCDAQLLTRSISSNATFNGAILAQKDGDKIWGFGYYTSYPENTVIDVTFRLTFVWSGVQAVKCREPGVVWTLGK